MFKRVAGQLSRMAFRGAEPRVSREEVAATIEAVEFPFGGANEIVRNYHRTFITRYHGTLNLIDELGLSSEAKVLELAAAPYGMTVLLSQYCFADMALATLGPQQDPTSLELRIAGNEKRFRVHTFNVERDTWPFPDGAFDLIIACEMVEHLLFDPMQVFVEANRCLKPDGRLLVTTPNACCLQNVIKMARFGVPGLAPHYRLPSTMDRLYERHNRELSPPALRCLFESAGFEVNRATTANYYPLDPQGLSPPQLRKLEALIGEPDMRGDTLEFIGAKRGPVVTRYPTAEHLYWPDDIRAQ